MTTPVGADVELDAEVETALNAGWITREDLALKRRLQGIRVPVANEQVTPDNDADGPGDEVVTYGKLRIVPVYFRLPENETRAKVYPYITIDFLTVVRDTEREHRGVADYGLTANAYTPPGMPSEGGRTELPVPYTIQYQITQWARYNRHDREIMTQLLTTRLEPRFGYLEMVGVDGVPDDGSLRRMDLLSGPTNGDTRDGNGKRVFRKMYTVGVQTELFHEEFRALTAGGRVVLDIVTLE
jgi:hypothetical protein